MSFPPERVARAAREARQAAVARAARAARVARAARAARRAAARQAVGKMTPEIVYDVPMSDGVPAVDTDNAETRPYGADGE